MFDREELPQNVISIPPRIHWKIRKAIYKLARRAKHIKERAATLIARGQPASFDDGEAAALDWAVGVLTRMAEADRIDLTQVPDIDFVEIQSRREASSRATGTDG